MKIQMLMKVKFHSKCHTMLILVKGWILLLCIFPKNTFCQIEIHFKVVEESPINTIIGNIHNQALNQKGGITSGDYYYKTISDIEPFALDSRSYEFKVVKRVDRETLCKTQQQNVMQNCQRTYQFIQSKILKDEKGQHFDSFPEVIVVHVEIIDINDNSPKWPTSQIYLSLPEHSKIGTEITLPLAIDPDQPPTNTTQKYTIGYQSIKDGFSIKHSGREYYNEKLSLLVNKDFDRETQATINVKLKAFDGDPHPLFGQLDINISLTDINDKQPHFKLTSIHKMIPENIPLRTQILQLEARDEDESDQHKLRFEFDNSVDETVKNRFYINPVTGEILTAGYIDYETKSEYIIPVIVTDGKHYDRAILTIEIKNVNDNHPEISVLYLSGSNFKTPGQSSQYRAYLAENKDPGFVIASFSVSDKDNEAKRVGNLMIHQLDCRIEPIRESLELKRSQSKLIDHFQIVTSKKFDREETSQYFAQLICFDSDSSALSTSVTFEISITDVNDNPPIFEIPFQGSRGTHLYNIKEGVTSTIVQVKATDRDIGNNAIIQYSLDSTSSKYFSIDQISGELRNKDPFDFEKTEKFELTINASNPIIEGKNSILLYTLQKITVNIEDVNDCPPVFDKDLYTFSVKEGPSKDVFVGKVDVKDDDISSNYNTNYFKILSNPNDYFESYDSHLYSNTNSDPSQYFRIGEAGFIYVNVPVLDREKISSFSFKIQAADRSEKPLSSTAIIQIQILDINDNPPSWVFPNTHNYEVNVSYQEAIGHCIAVLKANDPDLGDNGKITFKIVPPSFPSISNNNNEEPKLFDVTEPTEIKFKRHDIFDLDSSTGNIYVAQKMKISDIGSKKLWVEASDQGTPPLKKIERLYINIINIDNNGYGPSQGQQNKRSPRVPFENDLMIMIVLVAIIILVAMVMVIIILMLRCRNASRLLNTNKLCRDTCQSISASRSFLERRPDGHSCSPINDLCPPYTGPKRSQTISTYLGQSAGSSQMFDLTNGYLTDPNSRMQLDNCDSGMCHSMNRIPINRINNSTFSKKYYTSSALYRPNALWSNEGSPELSRRLCQKLNNNMENNEQSLAISPIHSEPSENTNDKEINGDFIPGNSTKKSITLPNFLTAIEECEDSAVHHMINDEPQFSFHQLSNYDKTQQRMSVTWLDKFNNESTLNANKKQAHQYKSADSCLNGPYLETQGSRDHEYTQLNVLPSDSTPVKVTHIDYPVTYV